MASIATSIQIIDRVSAPINNMIVALDNMCSAYESVQDSMNTGFNTRTIDQARQAIDAAAQQVTQLGINIEDNESMYYLQKCLKNMGIEAKLKEMGVCEGDTVILDDWELEWYE